MRYERTASFKADWNRLSADERTLVRTQLTAFNAAADDIASHGGDKRRWPTALRVHDLQGTKGVWSVTFHFAGPDMRATFEWGHDDNGPKVVWRRIGRHSVYQAP